MARFSSSAVGLALWTKTSISQSESLKNGQFRRIFVISPLFFSTFYKNAAQPLGFVWFWFKQHTCTPTQWYATRSAMTTPLQPVDVNTPAIKRKVARAVSNDRLHLAVETVKPVQKQHSQIKKKSPSSGESNQHLCKFSWPNSIICSISAHVSLQEPQKWPFST